jgi:hypothetical protein
VEGSGRDLIKVLSRSFPWKTEENHTELRLADVAVQIRNEHLPNISLKRHRYTTLRGFLGYISSKLSLIISSSILIVPSLRYSPFILLYFCHALNVLPTRVLKSNFKFQRTLLKYVGFEVLTAVVTKSTIFWNITPYSTL